MNYHQSLHDYHFSRQCYLVRPGQVVHHTPHMYFIQIAFFKHFLSVVRLDCQNIMCICIYRQRQILIRGKTLLKTVYQNVYAKAGNEQ